MYTHYYFCTFSICSTSGKITIRASNVTTFVLNDPEVTNATICDEGTKKDFESVFIDPISKYGYLIQKVNKENIVEHIENNVSIFKVHIMRIRLQQLFPLCY